MPAPTDTLTPMTPKTISTDPRDEVGHRHGARKGYFVGDIEQNVFELVAALDEPLR